MPSLPDHLYFQLYPTYLSASKDHLKQVNKRAYFRLSVWEQDHMLGEMMQGANPAILIDKIFLSHSIIIFNQKYATKQLVIKLTEYQASEKLLGVGTFKLQGIKKKFVDNNQRFYSLLQAQIHTQNGILKLVFSLFVESDRQSLNQYIRKFKQNQKEVLRAKRNINNYKRERQRKQQQLSNINESIRESDLERNEEQRDYHYTVHQKGRLRQSDQVSIDSAPPGTYLEINSAAKFHPKQFQKQIKMRKQPLNEDEERQFLAYAKIMQEYKAVSHIISAEDMETISVISDGSEESEMKAQNETETYSEKAVKKFKGNVNKLLNIFFILAAVLLIYFVIAPSKRIGKQKKDGKKAKKSSEQLLQLLDD